MIEKYKYVFMKYLYNKLGLVNIESKLINGGIKSLNFDLFDFSRYFVLLNDVDENALTGVLKERYNYYFSHTVEELSRIEIENELNNFLEESYKILLFPKVNSNYVYYGTVNDKYLAPRDSIALGFYYNEFDLDEEKFDELRFKNNMLICNSLNYIQDILGPNHNMKIAVIKYNELSLKKYSR